MNEPQPSAKQCRPIQKCNDKSHSYLARMLSSHIPATIKAALVSIDPSANFHVSSWNVIHSSNGKYDDEDSDIPENLAEHLLVRFPIGQDLVHLKL